jgi:hypothetical protein
MLFRWLIHYIQSLITYCLMLMPGGGRPASPTTGCRDGRPPLRRLSRPIGPAGRRRRGADAAWARSRQRRLAARRARSAQRVGRARGRRGDTAPACERQGQSGGLVGWAHGRVGGQPGV